MSRRRSEAKGILPANDLSRVFAWMRPNDLVWNWWNNYLMGKDPPAFDILAWSVDATICRLDCTASFSISSSAIPCRDAIRCRCSASP